MKKSTIKKLLKLELSENDLKQINSIKEIEGDVKDWEKLKEKLK